MSAYIFLVLPINILTTHINPDIGKSLLLESNTACSQELTNAAGPSPYIAWYQVARTLSLSFTFTILGRLSDIFGRRWFFIGLNIVALVGIIICSQATNINMLIAGATVYGIGETAQLSFNVAMGELVPNKYRPAVSSFIFLATAPITTFGPIISKFPERALH